MNFWDQVYTTEHFRYGVEPNDYVAESLQRLLGAGLDPAEATAVDVAAGEGRNAVFLAEQGFSTVAIDQSEVALEKTRSLAASRNVHLEVVHSDLFHWKPEHSFDLVVSTFLHVREPGQYAVLRRLEDLTAPGGYILAEFFHPDQRLKGFQSGGPPVPEMMVTPALAEEHIVNSELIISRALKRELREGNGHRGMGMVTQLLARHR